MIRFDVKFSVNNHQFEIAVSDQSFGVDVQFDKNDHFEASFGTVHEVTTCDPYKGEYQVTPAVDEQVLPTAQKLMADDMTVRAIPIFDVSNNSGGSTIYIAREVS